MSRFIFNLYQHFAPLVLRQPGKLTMFLLSGEGIQQGDPLLMLIYGTSLTPLIEYLLESDESVIHTWYADYGTLLSKASQISAIINNLLQHGPKTLPLFINQPTISTKHF